jgi:isopenicillin N synthase-like dioxygenase
MLPVVDVAPLLAPQRFPDPAAPGLLAPVARQIEAACREHGFFYVTGHGVAPDLQSRLAAACTAFFALPPADKAEIAMARGGPAWRGWFPVGAELTSGQPDLKEGLYSAPSSARRTPGSGPGCRCTAPTCSRGRCLRCAPPCSPTSTR